MYTCVHSLHNQTAICNQNYFNLAIFLFHEMRFVCDFVAKVPCHNTQEQFSTFSKDFNVIENHCGLKEVWTMPFLVNFSYHLFHITKSLVQHKSITWKYFLCASCVEKFPFVRVWIRFLTSIIRLYVQAVT